MFDSRFVAGKARRCDHNVNNLGAQVISESFKHRQCGDYLNSAQSDEEIIRACPSLYKIGRVFEHEHDAIKTNIAGNFFSF